jgi:hypothetical protein
VRAQRPILAPGRIRPRTSNSSVTGAVAQTGYSPLVQLPDGVLNAPQLQRPHRRGEPATPRPELGARGESDPLNVLALTRTRAALAHLGRPPQHLGARPATQPADRRRRRRRPGPGRRHHRLPRRHLETQRLRRQLPHHHPVVGTPQLHHRVTWTSPPHRALRGGWSTAGTRQQGRGLHRAAPTVRERTRSGRPATPSTGTCELAAAQALSNCSS